MKLTKRGRILGLTIVALSITAVGCNLPMPPAGMSLPPCATEDSVPTGGCSWDASERGNGAGADFWVVPRPSSKAHGSEWCYTYPNRSDLNICVPANHP